MPKKNYFLASKVIFCLQTEFFSYLPYQTLWPGEIQSQSHTWKHLLAAFKKKSNYNTALLIKNIDNLNKFKDYAYSTVRKKKSATTGKLRIRRRPLIKESPQDGYIDIENLFSKHIKNNHRTISSDILRHDCKQLA